MNESEFLDAAWRSCTRRIVAHIEERSANWQYGPTKDTRDTIVGWIRAMRVPAKEVPQ